MVLGYAQLGLSHKSEMKSSVLKVGSKAYSQSEHNVAFTGTLTWRKNACKCSAYKIKVSIVVHAILASNISKPGDCEFMKLICNDTVGGTILLWLCFAGHVIFTVHVISHIKKGHKFFILSM